MDKTNNSPVEGGKQAEGISDPYKEIKRLKRQLKEAERLCKQLRGDFDFQFEQWKAIRDERNILQIELEEQINSVRAITGKLKYRNALEAVCDTTKPLTVSDGTREAIKMIVLLNEVRECYQTAPCGEPQIFDRHFHALGDLLKNALHDSITRAFLQSHGITEI